MSVAITNEDDFMKQKDQRNLLGIPSRQPKNDF